MKIGWHTPGECDRTVVAAESCMRHPPGGPSSVRSVAADRSIGIPGVDHGEHRTTNPIAHFCQHCRMKKSRDAAAQLSGTRGRHPPPFENALSPRVGRRMRAVASDSLRLVGHTSGSVRQNVPAGNYSDETATPTQAKRIGGILGGISDSQSFIQLKRK
jgi:hypothetical protein